LHKHMAHERAAYLVQVWLLVLRSCTGLAPVSHQHPCCCLVSGNIVRQKTAPDRRGTVTTPNDASYSQSHKGVAASVHSEFCSRRHRRIRADQVSPEGAVSRGLRTTSWSFKARAWCGAICRKLNSSPEYELNKQDIR